MGDIAESFETDCALFDDYYGLECLAGWNPWNAASSGIRSGYSKLYIEELMKTGEWISENGKLKISEMKTGHLRNVYLFLDSRTYFPAKQGYMRKMKAELNRRGIMKPSGAYVQDWPWRRDDIGKELIPVKKRRESGPKKREITVKVRVADCGDCPYYVVDDTIDVGRGTAIHYCRHPKRGEENHVVAMGGDRHFGHPYPAIPVPDDCPELPRWRRKKSKSG